MKHLGLLSGMLLVVVHGLSAAEPALREQAAAAMRKAATFFHTQVATRGGYVYHYSTDLLQRWGEGKTTKDQIFVQPPGTPTVGMAYLKAYAATGEKLYLDAARAAAEALVYGQLVSGGWAQAVDFDPNGSRVALYRNGRGKGKNFSSFDDGQTQSALRFLIHADHALGGQHAGIRQSVEIALAAVLAAQHPNGAFPQGFDKPAPKYPAVKASFPTYDWRAEGKVKNYWDMPTLNDDLAGYMARLLEDGWTIRQDERCRQALLKLGGFLLLAQLPEPQPGWAQQYDFNLRPIWARKFEPPALAGRETQDAIETLLRIYRLTGDAKWLEPIPRALAWLKRSQLPDGRLARYYELRSNRPLYMTADYKLTYSDREVPDHYGWKTESRVAALEAALKNPKLDPQTARAAPISDAEVRQILQALDAQGRWVSTYGGEMLVGQPKFAKGMNYLSSAVFSRNLETLAAYVAMGK
jgi:PelA/Pel-15E family pectate lyase